MQASLSNHQHTSYSEIWRKIQTVFWITLFWLLLALYQYVDRYSILLTEGCIDTTYEHGPFIRGLLISVLLGGLLVGTGLVFLWEKWLRKMAFLRALSYMVLWYGGLYVVINWVAILSFAQTDPSILIEQSMAKTLASTLSDLSLLPNFFFWLLVMLLTLTFFLIRDKFGPTMFWRFIRGKYFRPKREERIFMFMDLKSSTTIAEKLGEMQYFSFLNDTFKIATPGILATAGEIYQYVGDEIVVTWKKQEGIYQANCIQCYYAMIKHLQRQADYFQTKYGVQPQFKAGLHTGFAIAGEMGIIKREIVYAGDVLNTAARIQSLCNEKNAKIILSKDLMDQIDNKFMQKTPKILGAINLRGKSEALELVTLVDV